MGVSNFGLKIWPEVQFWPFRHMCNRKLAENTPDRGPVSKISRYIGNQGTEISNLESNFTPEVVLWPFLHMCNRNWPEIVEDVIDVLPL